MRTKISISWALLALFAGFALAMWVIGSAKADSEYSFVWMMLRSQQDKINQQNSFINELKTKLNNANELLNKCDKNLFIPN